MITIGKLQISDATSGTSSQGVLFGTVTGTVRNVIVNITDDEATYKRTSDAGVTSSEQDTSGEGGIRWGNIGAASETLRKFRSGQ